MTIREALKSAEAQLISSAVPDARLDAEYLLAGVLDAPRLMVLASGETPLTDATAGRFFALVRRRASREPLQYILGTQPFMGCTFMVDDRALIPRQDTEILGEQALLRAPETGRALDLCTGSGALAVVLSRALPGLHVTASDISPAALALARQNALLNGVSVDFREGDLFAPVSGETFDLIVSNPPYIPSGDLSGLQEEVKREPRLALDGGPDGLSFYRQIAAQAPHHLTPGGFLLMEIGCDQAPAVTALLLDAGFPAPEVIRDLAGRDRVIAAQKPSAQEACRV